MGKIVKISGPLVVGSEMLGSRMYDVVRVGKDRIIGEIIQLDRDKAVIQVYEDTSGIRPGEPIKSEGAPLSVELGPGIMKNIFDGVQRPLESIKAKSGAFIARGIEVDSLDRKKKWEFAVEKGVAKGTKVSEGQIIGYVQETPLVRHQIMVPKGVSGKISSIKAGKYTIEDEIAQVESAKGKVKLTMMQKRTVREAGKYLEKLQSDVPLITGQRVIDFFFPVAKGGAAAVPGPFGAGKTVIQQQLARWSDADIVVYVGCGERGNEMTEVLTEFPELKDPKTGRPLMERTILVANTSNMPVAAREASVYTGITIAEYFRDMGYNVALMADSTSRWAEAMREISARLEEMPGEEGYPAYLPKRLAEFYERAGRVRTFNEKIGSITVVGAVSPAGGDISEPVSQGTLRVVKTFWALDASLANSRHFPSINWLTSYSLYKNALDEWYTKSFGAEFVNCREEAMRILQRESELKDIVQLVGEDALPESEKLLLEVGKIIREDFLRQSAFDEIDTFTSLKKQKLMMETIIHYRDKAIGALEKGVSAEKITAIKARTLISRMKDIKEGKDTDLDKEAKKIMKEVDLELEALEAA